MNILITGGAGFIGSNTAKKLKTLGHNIIILDNFSTGHQNNIENHDNTYIMDITKNINKPFEDHKIDAVYDFAAHCSVRDSINDPINDAINNVIGGINVLETCRKFNVNKVIFASSGGTVYGENTGFPSYIYDDLKPICPYGAAKASVEKYIEYYKRTHKMNITILRYGNVYGFGQNTNCGVISLFIEKMLKDENPVMFGDGESIRDYIYIDDVVEVNIKALKMVNEILNVGTGVMTSTNQIFTELNKLFNNKFVNKYAEKINGEVKMNYIDVSALKRHYEPKITLKKGIELIWEKYKEKLESK